MPWSEADRAKYDVIRERYSSDLSDAEFGLIFPLLPTPKRRGAYRLDGRPDLVSGVGQARRVAQGLSRRGGRPRSLQTLLRAARRQARAVQRPSLARTQGPDRHRQRARGPANARPSRRGQRSRPQRPRRGRSDAADARSANVDQTLQRHRPGAGSPSIETCRPSPDRSEPADGRTIARDTIS